MRRIGWHRAAVLGANDGIVSTGHCTEKEDDAERVERQLRRGPLAGAADWTTVRCHCDRRLGQGHLGTLQAHAPTFVKSM